MPYVIEVEHGKSLRFRLSGRIAEPDSPRWKSATEGERARYWPIFAETLLAEWRGQMLGGLGRRGRVPRAKKISRELYRRAGLGWRGPGLLPQREESRSFRLAKITPYPDLGRVTGYFAAGWGRILSYHFLGESGRGVPIFRDGELVGWRGIKGQTTGIIRDILPSENIIRFSADSAAKKWARAVGPNRGGSGSGPGPKPPKKTPAKAKKREGKPPFGKFVPPGLIAPTPKQGFESVRARFPDYRRDETQLRAAMDAIRAEVDRAERALSELSRLKSAAIGKYGEGHRIRISDEFEIAESEWRIYKRDIPYRRKWLLSDHISESADKDFEWSAPHGTPDHVHFDRIRIGGYEVRFQARWNDLAASQLLELLDRGDSVPRRIADQAGVIYLIQGRNRHDEYWERTYGIPDFRSAATGGDGNIVAYNAKEMSIGTFSHECGHNLAKRLYGQTKPADSSDYKRAMDEEPSPPSAYGSKSPSEDFAESCRLYVEERERFRSINPKRYEVIRRIVSDETYPG